MSNLNLKKPFNIYFIAVCIGLIAVFLTVISFADRAQEKAGDLNSSGKVDISDLSILLSRFNSNDSVSDTNDDGVVNIFDLSLLLSNFGKTTAPNPVIHFTEDFSSGTISPTKWLTTACLRSDNTSSVRVVNDPVRVGGKSALFLVNNDDVSGMCKSTGLAKTYVSPTENPRGQLETQEPAMYGKGEEFYVNIGTFYPSNFTRNNFTKDGVKASGFLMVGQIFGPPFGGKPPLALDVTYNSAKKFNDLSLQGAPGPGKDVQVYWRSGQQLPYGTRWDQVTMRVKLSDVATEGYVELWYNGVQQTFNNGSKRLYTVTLLYPDGNQSIVPTSYRTHDLVPGDLTIYHDDIRVGDTYESVQPK